MADQLIGLHRCVCQGSVHTMFAAFDETLSGRLRQAVHSRVLPSSLPDTRSYNIPFKKMGSALLNRSSLNCLAPMWADSKQHFRVGVI
jgi:hypothetical protein